MSSTILLKSLLLLLFFNLFNVNCNNFDNDDLGESILTSSPKSSDLYKPCSFNFQCSSNLKCKNFMCICEFEYLEYSLTSGKCERRKIGSECENDSQCSQAISHSECVDDQCKCRLYFRPHKTPSNTVCVARNSASETAIEIYKLAIIFATGCLVVILVVFMFCILRKSLCTNPQLFDQHRTNSIPEIFAISGHQSNINDCNSGFNFNGIEKPPTYEETVRIINQEIGIPPPDYRLATSAAINTPPAASLQLSQPVTSANNPTQVTSIVETRIPTTQQSTDVDITVQCETNNSQIVYNNSAYVN